MSTESGVRPDGKRRGRLYAGVGALVLSAGYGCVAATTLPLGSPGQPGAAVFPLAAAAITAFASLMVLLEQFAKGAGTADDPLALPRGEDRRRVIGFVLFLAVYAIVAGYLGNLVASFVMGLGMVHLVDSSSWRRTIVAAAAIAVSAHVLFVLVFAVPLPEGSLLR